MSEDRSNKSALDRTAEQFHILVDSVEEYAIYMLDATGNVVTWNTGAQKIKGYAAEEIIGKNFACFYTADDVAADKPQRNLREAARKGHIRDQGPRAGKDGSIFQAEIVLTALRDDAGNIRGYSKVTRDVTDQIRSSELEAEKIVAEKANKAKDDFLAALSHELRTPLTPALAAARYLENNASKFPSEFAEDLKIIKRNVQLQARLIDDLLDVTRITRGKLQLHREPVDANALVRDAIDIAHSAIAAKNLKVSTQLNAKAHQILADSIRLQQVFWNLINNAVKFTSPGGQIEISTFSDDGCQFHFEITDNGIGIERDRLPSLFTPFEPADPSVSRQFGGLGLGLVIPNVWSIFTTAQFKQTAAAEASELPSRSRLTLFQKEPKNPRRIPLSPKTPQSPYAFCLWKITEIRDMLCRACLPTSVIRFQPRIPCKALSN